MTINALLLYSLGQYKSSLVILTRDVGKTSQKKSKKIISRNATPKGEKRFLTITSGLKGTTIYIDGQKARFYPNCKLLSNKNRFLLSCLVLGNDPTGKKPWKGEIFGFSIYDQELSEPVVFQNFQYWTHGDFSKLSRQDGIIALYPMDEQTGQRIYNRLADRYYLWIPNKFRIPKPLILDPPWRGEGFKKYWDIVINVLGFIPFGFFGLAYFSSIRRPPYSSSLELALIVILFGSIVSLIIELLQVYLPSRYSSLTDLICNIIGTAAGAFLYRLAIRKFPLLVCSRHEAQ